MSGWESAGFPQTCACIRSDVLSTPCPSQAYIGDFREQKMYKLGYTWGSELVGDDETKYEVLQIHL